MEGQCSSYEVGEQICRDGFPITAACLGARCFECGQWAADRKLPHCLNEDLAPRFFDERGMPIFARNK